MLDIVTLRCHKLGVHGTATGHRTLQGPVFWTGSPCPSDEDAGPAPAPSLSSSLTGKIDVNNFLATVGMSGASGGDSGTQGDPGLGFDAIPLTR